MYLDLLECSRQLQLSVCMTLFCWTSAPAHHNGRQEPTLISRVPQQHPAGGQGLGSLTGSLCWQAGAPGPELLRR